MSTVWTTCVSYFLPLPSYFLPLTSSILHLTSSLSPLLVLPSYLGGGGGRLFLLPAFHWFTCSVSLIHCQRFNVSLFSICQFNFSNALVCYRISLHNQELPFYPTRFISSFHSIHFIDWVDSFHRLNRVPFFSLYISLLSTDERFLTFPFLNKGGRSALRPAPTLV